MTITAASAEDYWSTRIAAHPLGVATLPLLERAGVLPDVRSHGLAQIANNWTIPTGEVHLPAQYVLAEAAR